MTRQIVIESPAVNRNQPLLPAKDEMHRRIGEVAGETTAECAAVCCCCPCALMHLLILAVYKVPTGLCKRAWRKQKRKRLLKKKALLRQQSHQQDSGPNSFFDSWDGSDGAVDEHGATEAVELDLEMWDRFYGGAGFWRSPSQRED